MQVAGGERRHGQYGRPRQGCRAHHDPPPSTCRLGWSPLKPELLDPSLAKALRGSVPSPRPRNVVLGDRVVVLGVGLGNGERLGGA